MDHLVWAVRGRDADRCEASVEELDNIWNFLENIRLKAQPLSGQQAAHKILVQPDNIRDWFVPRGVQGGPNLQYHLNTEPEENEFHQHIVRLHHCGIPAFFREQTSAQLTKLFASVEAFVPLHLHEKLNHRDTLAVMSAVRERVLDFVIPCMAAEAARYAGHNLVAVFDASGPSAATSRWKISLRIVFFEIFVTLDAATMFRESLVRRLAEAMPAERDEPWAAAFEAVDCNTGNSYVAANASNTKEEAVGFWDKAIDKRVLMPKAAHRVVWCDTLHSQLAYPERRPLRPYALMDIFAASVAGTSVISQVEVRDLALGKNLTAQQWLRLGSLWVPPEEQPTPLRQPAMSPPLGGNAAMPAMSPFLVTGAVPNPAAVRGAPAIHPDWDKHQTPDGRTYYCNRHTMETRWHAPPHPTLPPPAVACGTDARAGAPGPFPNPAAVHGTQAGHPDWDPYQSSDGSTYYHNRVTNETSWTLPPQAAARGTNVLSGAIPNPATARAAPGHTGWERLQSDDGRPYYWNPVTTESRWDPPPEAATGRTDGCAGAPRAMSAATAQPVPQNDHDLWTTHYTDSGQAYYHQASTNKTVWDLPPGARRAPSRPH